MAGTTSDFMHALAELDAANICADGPDVVIAHVAAPDHDEAADVASSFDFAVDETEESHLEGRGRVTYRRGPESEEAVR